MTTVKYFKALADETRLRLFRLLMDHEFNVNEIVALMEMGQSRISRHLKILTDTGLLSCRRDGSFMYYHSVKANEIEDLIRFVEKSVRKHQEFSEDRNRAQELVRERKSRSQRFFNDIAEKWDDMKRDVFGDLDLAAQITRRITPCRTAADLGCGTGELLVFLAARADRVIGVDSSPNMLEQARMRTAAMKTTVDLRLGELEHLPIRDGETGVAVANMVLHHLAVPAAGIREAWRILEPGGILLIADFDKHKQEMVRERYGDPWLGFTGDEIRTWLADAGFALSDSESFDVLNGLKVNLFVAEKK